MSNNKNQTSETAPMKIIVNTEDIKLKIESSFERILNNCTDEIKTNIQTLPIIVSDDLKAEEIYKDDNGLFKRAYSEGFGGVKGNITYQGIKVHLVVLNITKISNFGLTDCEFDGVFSHELGHIFNESPKREVPSILKGNSKTEIDNAKKIEREETEIYADYFSKVTNSSSGLISSIEKFLATQNGINSELFNQRLEKLKSECAYIGQIKAIKK